MFYEDVRKSISAKFFKWSGSTRIFFQPSDHHSANGVKVYFSDKSRTYFSAPYKLISEKKLTYYKNYILNNIVLRAGGRQLGYHGVYLLVFLNPKTKVRKLNLLF